MHAHRSRLFAACALLPLALSSGCSGGQELKPGEGVPRAVSRKPRPGSDLAEKVAAEAAIRTSEAEARVGVTLSATDGMGALRQVSEAYRRCKTFRATLKADITVNFGRMPRFGQETLVAYSQSPTHVLLRVRDPIGGTNDYLADGRSMVHYSGIRNAYTRRTASFTLPQIVERINRDTPLAFNPLSFAAADGLPPGIEMAQIGPDEVLAERNAAVVHGRLTPKYAAVLGKTLFGKEHPARERTFRLWIDPTTSLVRKSEIRLSWTLPSRPGGSRSAPPAPTLHIVERSDDIIFDVELPRDQFKFAPPDNAKEIFDPVP